MFSTRTLFAAIIAFLPPAVAMAQESTPPGQSCPVDTTVDKDTGKPRTGVQVCGGGGSGSVGVSVTGKEVEHFLKYPFGQSDQSVVRKIFGKW